MARTSGVDRGRTLLQYDASLHFTADERLVLRFADLLTATPADVPDDAYAAVVKRFGEDGTVELASAIAWENYRVRFNRAFEVESEGFCSVSTSHAARRT
jgi:alkylhydroperoxidase family enzyme